MKKIMLLMNVGIFFACILSAQVTQDSLKILGKEKETLKLQKTLNDRKIELGKLENQWAEKTDDVQKWSAKAKEAAIENEEAAGKLSDDSQSKKRAKKARKSANEAEDAAKKARKATEKLADLTEDIEKLRKKIAEDEQKIAISLTTHS